MRLIAIVLTLTAASPAFAQSASVTGNVSALVDHLPNVPAPGAAAGTDPVTELRLRAIVDAQMDARPWLRFRFAGVADGLAADRGGAVRAASADALEAWVELSGPGADLRAGMSRIAWGRLDEVQPTDVINPIDVSRYLLDGRSEARIAVPLVRGRLFPSDQLTVEGIIVPHFRHGRFDRLDEPSSPFNLLADASPAETAFPGFCGPVFTCAERWSFTREPLEGRVQAGARATVTTGRVDWSLSGWRGFLPFGLVARGDPRTGIASLEHRRFTMLGADFETVRGTWAIRGEAAFFPARPTQGGAGVGIFESDALEAGAGVDRRAGDFTLSATVLLRADARRYRTPEWPLPRQSYKIVDERLTSVSIVGGFSRTFNRDRVETRVFSLVNPEDRAAFVRGVLAWKPADDVAVETSLGWFIGEGDDVITRFGDRDFGYVRLKYYFGR
jgi:hypothetical protein